MRLTPHPARVYLLAAAFLLALPTLTGLYTGHSGRLLVATVKIPPGGPFYRSVVYIASHGFFSAHGFVVNLPMEDGDAFLGGPLAKENFVILARGADGAVSFSSADENGREIYGYAGWGPLQLNYEIVRGGWDVIDYDPALVFDTPIDDMWDAARKRVFEQQPVADSKVL